MIIGGWAFNYHAIPRATGDIDFFVSDSIENQKKIRAVLKKFGFESSLPPENTLLFSDKKIIMLGRQPNRIDLLVKIDGVSFEEAWANKIESSLDGVPTHYISRAELLKNKRSTGRTKDKADVETLEKLATKR